MEFHLPLNFSATGLSGIMLDVAFFFCFIRLVGWLEKITCGTCHGRTISVSSSLTFPRAIMYWYLYGGGCYWRRLLVPVRAAGVMWLEDGPPCWCAFCSVPWVISSLEYPPTCSCLHWLESLWVSSETPSPRSVFPYVNLSLPDNASSIRAYQQRPMAAIMTVAVTA